MKLEEARKLATPGPLTLNGLYIHGVDKSEGVLPVVGIANSRVDAALLAHAYNMLPDSDRFIDEHVGCALQAIRARVKEGKYDVVLTILGMLEMNQKALLTKLREVPGI